MKKHDADKHFQASDQVHHDRMQLLQASAFSALTGAVLATVLFTYVLYNQTNNELLISWFVFVMVIQVVRYFIASRDMNCSRDSYRWERQYATGTIISSLGWGIGSYLLIPADNHLLLSFVILVIGGVSAAAAVTYAASRIIAAMFIIPATLPLTIFLFQQHSNEHFTMGVLSLVFAVMMLISNHHMFNEMNKNIILAKDNEELIISLVESNKQAGELNAQLEEKINQVNSLANRMSYEAAHDMLTGLINRREFEKNLSQLVDSARQNNLKHCMCYIDLDDFKVLNDTCGHIAGDELLQKLSLHLANKIRNSDILARLGGDEFGLLLTATGIEVAETVARDFLKEIAMFKFYWKNKIFEIGASIGIVEISDESGSVTDILKSADSACYVAKESGKNRIHIFQEDDDALSARLQHMHNMQVIQAALKNDRFELYFQLIKSRPDIAIMEMHGEFLLRMLGEDNEVITPETFISSAERYHLMQDIDRWVVRNALKFVRKMELKYKKGIICSINLSGQSVCDNGFLSYVIHEINSSKVSPGSLCFEITETSAIENFSHAEHFFNSLKGIGCRFALDDFGSGLSSFGYLKQLDVDYLKIDGSFVKNIIDDKKDFSIVKSINQIGQEMGIKTIAEFVENDQLRDKLFEMGVDYVQGNGIARPEPALTFI